MKSRFQRLNIQLQSKIVQRIEQLGNVSLYPNSVHIKEDHIHFLVREGINKYLIVTPTNKNELSTAFEGEKSEYGTFSHLKCPLNHINAVVLRNKFGFTNPVPVGKKDSYGFGDRLGNANPAHVRAVRHSRFKPILAQQSIRELDRTGRTAEEVLDVASWAVFQEGYHDGFGADADHLKTTDDVDRMIKAGYTMFTIDPSDYVINEVSTLNVNELKSRYNSLPWDKLKDTPDFKLTEFVQNEISLNNGFILNPSSREVLEGMVKYGRVITNTQNMANYISKNYPDHQVELELSVDETDEPTTLFEHYLIASELDRLGVELVSLAPRFCGDFEKGIDFKGDLNQFREEYIQHLAIADMFGGYKLSIHSGSDKFSVYEVIGLLDAGAVHVKTAGTSYLEALRTIAEVDPDLFRKILTFSINRFPKDRKTYHISANTENIKNISKLSEQELVRLLDDNDARQLLHVTYGSILSGTLPEAKTFKPRLMEVLECNENLHEQNLIHHFKKHLEPFE